jgi:hypothetical protein
MKQKPLLTMISGHLVAANIIAFVLTVGAKSRGALDASLYVRHSDQ